MNLKSSLCKSWENFLKAYSAKAKCLLNPLQKFLQIKMQHPKCPECGSGRVHAKLSEIFCGKCGFVLEEQLFVGS